MTKSLQFLSGGGEMGALMRAYNWETSSIGPADKWPQSFRTTLSILLNSKFPMFLYWGPNLVCFYNDAYRFSLGNDGKHPLLLGMKAEEAWPETWHILKPPIDQVLKVGEATWSEDQFVPIYREGAMKDAYWTFSFSPVKNESNETAGVFLTLIETTDKVNNLKKLIETNDQLAFAIEATQLGTWDFNPLTNKFIGNHYFKEWFYLPNGEEIDISIGINLIAENDRSRVSQAVQTALEYESGGFYDVEYSIINPITKQERIVRAKGKAWFGDDKKAYRFNGTLQDITQEATAKIKIEESEQRFRNLILQAPVLITTFDGPSYKIATINKKALEIWGKSYEQVINKPLFEVSPETEDGLKAIFSNIYTTGEPFIANEYMVQLKRPEKPDTAYFNSVYQPLRNLDNKIYGIISIGTEVTEAVNARKQIEARTALLQKEHQLLQNYFIEAPAFFVILKGKDHVFEFANTMYHQLIGNRDILGKKMMEVLPELKGQGFDVLVDEIHRTGKPFSGKEMPAFIEQEKGKLKQIYIDLHCQAIKNDEGYIEGILIFGYDVTELVVARKQIEASEKLFSNILSQSIMAIGILKGTDMVVTFANDSLLATWGKGQNIIGKPLLEVMPEIKDQGFPQLLQQVYTTGVPFYGYETKVTLIRNGKEEPVYYNFVYQPYTEVDNSIAGITILATEVTEQVLAKKQIEESEEEQKKSASHLKMATDSANIGIWSLDIVSSKLEWSNIHKVMWGYDENCVDLTYEDWHKVIVPEDKEMAFQKIEESKANNGVYEVEYRINKADDNVIRSIRSVGKYYYNEKGEAETLTGISVDITEEKQAEEALRKSKERLQGGLNVANVALAEINYHTGLVSLSPEAALMYGLPADNLTVTRKQLHDTFHPDWKQDVEKHIEQVIKPEGSGLMEVEHQIVLPGGEVRWLKINKQFFFDRTVQPAKPLYSILAAQDITAKKEAEEKIKESVAKFRTLSETIPIMVWTADPDGKKNFFNQYFLSYTGLSFEELKSDGMLEIIFPDELKKDLQLWQHSIKTGEDFKMEKRLRRHDGTYRWHLGHGIAQKDINGKITGWIGSNTDIHEQKTKEQQKDEFISIASHEMKTPLTTAKGYLELLILLLSEENQTAFLYANKANQSVERLHRLVTELLDASKIQNGKLNYNISTFDFNEMLDEAIQDIQVIAKNHIIQKTGSSLKQITGDKGRLQQVLINLLNNAVKYSPKADRVLVKIEEQDNKIQVSVQDFGIGMSIKHLDKIFDRYYRAQEHAISFQGLGIGLYISNNIIERHNGTLWAESEPDKGSTFYFTLPV